MRLCDVETLAVIGTDKSSPVVFPLPMNWRAAAGAGIVAGIVATVVQIALWWAVSDVLPDILFRDARLTAALVLGQSVLPPPATFDGRVMLVATLVHFLLSMAYGMALAPLLAPLGLRRSLLSGTLLGLLLYAVNMYGFTCLFPWFSVTRGWITLVAHGAFGMALPWGYRILAGRSTR